ncbi:hypothetical protein K8T06_01020 [bacterium]|nr:hypothetical protein [bacterium]
MGRLNDLTMIFQKLLNSMWGKMVEISEVSDPDSLLDDWKQANWELIVESKLSANHTIYLQPYGNGADYYGNSSRILCPEGLPTHAVNCVSDQPLNDRITGDLIHFPDNGLPFECLVTMRDGWYYEEPPFDSILIIINGVEFVVGFEEVNFILVII